MTLKVSDKVTPTAGPYRGLTGTIDLSDIKEQTI
jgi:hypothetical protein